MVLKRAVARAAARAVIEPMEARVLLAMPTLWTTTGPGGGGATLSAVISPDGQDLWASSDMSGIYHSRNFGQTWEMVNFHNSIGGINGGTFSQARFTSDPNILYMASTSAGPVKSTDRGATWTPLSGWTRGGGAYWMATDLSTTTKMLVSDGTGLYLSTNGGTSFTTAYTASNLFVAGAFFDGSNVYVGTNNGFLISSDGGASFALAAQQPTNTNIMSFTGAKQGGTVRLFAMTTSSTIWDGYSPADLNYNGLFRLDVGGSWVDVSSGVTTGEDANFVSMAQNNISVVYIGGGDVAGRTDVLKSTDGGTTFADTFFTRPWDVTPNVPNANVATGYEGQGGDFDWSFGGAAWGFSVSPTDANKVIISDGWVHVTSDGGTTWQQVYENQSDSNPMGQYTPQHKAYSGSGPTMTSVHYIEWTSPSNIMAGYTDIDGWRSTDGGTSWSHPDFNGVVVNTLYKTIFSGGLLYGATSNVHDMYQSTHLDDTRCNPSWQTGAVVVSADQGATWSNIHSFGVPILWIQLDPNNPNRMYAAAVDGVGSNGGIWVTSNLNAGTGSTWTKLANPPRTEGHAYTIQVLNDGTLVATYSGRRSGNVFTDSSGVFVSTDNGATWLDRTGPEMHWYTMEVTVDPTDPAQNTWYAGVNNAWGGAGNGMGDLYRTTDRGVTWTRMNIASSFGRTYVDVHGVTINPTTKEMFVASGTQGIAYAPDVTVSGFSAANFSNVLSYPFAWNERVFINPYNSNDVWVASFGGGAIRGGVAPDNLVGTAAGMTQINLSWSDNSSNESGFAIDRATDAAFSQNLQTLTAAQNATSTSVTGLNPGTTYYFRIRATHGTNRSVNSLPASATTLSTPVPVAPSGLFTTIISSSQINLSWSDNSNNEQGFYLDQASDAGFGTNFTTATIGADLTSYSAMGLTADTTYYFRIRSFNSNGISANSNTASATTLPLTPAAPTGLSASAISFSQINLAWTDNSTGETGFYLDRATSSGFSSNLVSLVLGPNATSYSVSGLAGSSTYYFRLRAYNSNGISANSNTASATTLEAPPAAPSGLTASASSQSQISLSWIDNASDETGFYLDRASDSGFASNLLTTTLSANTTSANATGLTSGTMYYFRVRAYKGANSSANTPTASASTLPDVPLAPGGLAASATSSSQISLSWSDASNNEAGFYLDRASDSGFASGLVTTTLSANTTSTNATGLSPLSSYYFRIRAYNSGGVSSNSNTASATTLEVPPAAPSGLVATALSASQIGLSWSDNSSDESGFYLDRASDSGFTSGLLTSTLSANATSTSVSGLASASTYYFRIRAYKAASPSANSPTASATTLHAAPTDITLSSSSIAENQPSGTPIGTLSSVDPDAGDTFSYSLVAGAGSTDNASFSLSGNRLLAAVSFDYESKSSYSLRIRSTDAGGMAFEKALTITVTNGNDAPADITLDPAAVLENQPAGTLVGNLSSSDPDAAESFTYSLVPGSGSEDNASFTLSGDALLTAQSFDYELRDSYSIRVRTTDSTGLFLEKSLTIRITNENEPPTDIVLSGDWVAENQPAGTVVGSLSTTDRDGSDSFTYSFVEGEGGEDNDRFMIEGDVLLTAQSFDFEARSSYHILLRSTDAGGLYTEQSFVLTVTDENEAPTDMTLSSSSIAENQPAGTLIGTLSSVDADAAESFSYSLVEGEGSEGNASFTINGNQLLAAQSFNYESQSRYSLRIRSTDRSDLSLEKVFTITVSDVAEPPTDIALSNSSVPEDQPLGTLVGSFTASSDDPAESFSYELVSGMGGEDNDRFTLSDNQLKTAATFAYLPGKSYSVLVRATAANGLSLDRSFPIEVLRADEFGMTGGKKPVSFSLTDQDGDQVTYKLTGGGLGAVWGDQISLIGTGSKSVLTISVKKNKNGGDGFYHISALTSDGLLKSINAKAVAIEGGNMLLNSLQQAPGKSQVSIKLLQVSDGTIEVQQLPIRSLTLLDWQDVDEEPDQLLASSIGTISVKGRKASRTAAALPGDLDAEVLVSGGIKKIQVAGTLAGDVTVGTTIGSYKAGAITGTITQGAATLLGSNALSDVLAELSGTFAG